VAEVSSQRVYRSRAERERPLMTKEKTDRSPSRQCRARGSWRRSWGRRRRSCEWASIGAVAIGIVSPGPSTAWTHHSRSQAANTHSLKGILPMGLPSTATLKKTLLSQGQGQVGAPVSRPIFSRGWEGDARGHAAGGRVESHDVEVRAAGSKRQPADSCLADMSISWTHPMKRGDGVRVSG
jgi:hypothetical protein